MNARQPEKATEFAASAAEPPQLNPSRVETPVPPRRFSVKGPRRRHLTNGKCSPFLESRRDMKCDEADQRGRERSVNVVDAVGCYGDEGMPAQLGVQRGGTKERVRGSRPERGKDPAASPSSSASNCCFSSLPRFPASPPAPATSSPPFVQRADPHNPPFIDGAFDFAFSARLDKALFPARFAREMDRRVRSGGSCVYSLARPK
ncbi:hypothetical protein Ahy_B08g091314 isoform E [Arachis hypogaea]|uniref:Methyltransferase type 11 domain-containing protein n=1 Tax=Arachis hypogaea TaxID=3818 RepID=A0A444Y1W8_ARAHY|nr:hypothetical protein Ahy_B08g091314 isoform E [Arachis hypogaea]